MFADITILVDTTTANYRLSTVLTVRSRPDNIAADVCLASDGVRHSSSIDKRLAYFIIRKIVCMPEKNRLAHSATINKIAYQPAKHSASERVQQGIATRKRCFVVSASGTRKIPPERVWMHHQPWPRAGRFHHRRANRARIALWVQNHLEPSSPTREVTLRSCSDNVTEDPIHDTRQFLDLSRLDDLKRSLEYRLEIVGYISRSRRSRERCSPVCATLRRSPRLRTCARRAATSALAVRRSSALFW